MENENKERIILNDEELKEVTGGMNINAVTRFCAKIASMYLCIEHDYCAWIDNTCKPDPRKYK